MPYIALSLAIVWTGLCLVYLRRPLPRVMHWSALCLSAGFLWSFVL